MAVEEERDELKATVIRLGEEVDEAKVDDLIHLKTLYALSKQLKRPRWLRVRSSSASVWRNFKIR